MGTMIMKRSLTPSSWMGCSAIVVALLVCPLVGCGGGDAPSKEAAAPAPQGAPAGGGMPIEDEGAPGEAGGAPQDPAGQDAPSPDAPAPEVP
jgi:hypothetical protein